MHGPRLIKPLVDKHRVRHAKITLQTKLARYDKITVVAALLQRVCPPSLSRPRLSGYPNVGELRMQCSHAWPTARYVLTGVINWSPA